MEKYKASTPQAEVIGTALKAYNDSIEYSEFKHILERYGLTEIDGERWYPQQLTLDIQKSIKAQRGGGMSLVSVGMKIIDNAIFPPMNSLEDALNAFSASYPMNFRHQSPHDVIRAEKISDYHIRVINASPHSDEMIYGYVYAMVRRFAPPGSGPVVKFADTRKIDSDEDTVIEVTWG